MYKLNDIYQSESIRNLPSHMRTSNIINDEAEDTAMELC